MLKVSIVLVWHFEELKYLSKHSLANQQNLVLDRSEDGMMTAPGAALDEVVLAVEQQEQQRVY